MGSGDGIRLYTYILKSQSLLLFIFGLSFNYEYDVRHRLKKSCIPGPNMCNIPMTPLGAGLCGNTWMREKHKYILAFSMFLLILFGLTLCLLFHERIHIPHFIFFFENWNKRSESLSEIKTYKKYKLLKKSIGENEINIHKDPFTENGLKYLNHSNTFYSIGPDRVDQKLKILYDPTNGIFSSGDIMVKKYE